MATALVTGGCGFIGSHFVKLFLQKNPDSNLINLDKLTYCGNRENTRGCESNPHYEFVQGDIADSNLVQSLMKKVNAVIHFAAETHVDRSIANADDFLITNVIGTRTLLEAARNTGVTRFIHVSTDEVYGSIAEGHAKEDAPLEPSSPYSASKAASDLMALAYWKTYKLPLMVTRSSNNYGPNQFPEKVIPLFITNLMEGKKVPLYGKGLNRRDWIYVEDNCEGIYRVFEKGIPGEIYNVGGGTELSNLELTHQILSEMGLGTDRINPVEDRLGHDFRYGISIEKMQALGYQPRWSFEKGLAETIRWYQAHPEWWQPLKKDRFTIK